MSDKTIAQRLFIKPDYKVLVINPPDNYVEKMGELPDRVTLVTKTSEPADLVQLFVKTRKELESQLSSLKKLLKPEGLLWISYPKLTSKLAADINRDSINEYAMSLGWQGVAMISIDETWSALRLKYKE